MRIREIGDCRVLLSESIQNETWSYNVALTYNPLTGTLWEGNQASPHLSCANFSIVQVDLTGNSRYVEKVKIGVESSMVHVLQVFVTGSCGWAKEVREAQENGYSNITGSPVEHHRG